MTFYILPDSGRPVQAGTVQRVMEPEKGTTVTKERMKEYSDKIAQKFKEGRLHVDGDNRHALELLEAQSNRVAEAQFQRDRRERQEQAQVDRQRCLQAHLERCRLQPIPAVVIRRPKPTLEERMARAYNRLKRERVPT